MFPRMTEVIRAKFTYIGEKNENHHKGVQEYQTKNCVFYKQHRRETVNSQASTTQTCDNTKRIKRQESGSFSHSFITKEKVFFNLRTTKRETKITSRSFTVQKIKFKTKNKPK